jgi:CheY-like chemotaxis protein
VFTLRLPLAANQAADAPIAEPPLARLAQTRILVVDDNGDAAESLGMVLRLLGADVRVAHDGHQAIEAFGAYGPAVVLLDIGMPGMDGYEVARTLRRRFPDHRAALVALTGWGQAKDRRLSQEAGFDHHLVKPADINALQALLASLAGDGAAGTGSGLSGT